MKVVHLLCGLASVSTPALSGGFSLKSQDAATLGTALAGAQAKGATPGAAFYNPASIVGVDGLESSFSVIAGIVNTSYDSAEGALFGVVPVAGRASGESVVPDAITVHSAFAAPLTDRIFVGAAVNIPFGFASEYADDSVIRYHGTKSKVLSFSLTPIVGIALNEDWAIAAGPRIQYFRVEFDSAIDAAGVATGLGIDGFIPGADDVYSYLEADDFGLGYVVGLQGRLAPNVRVGASFTSKIDHEFSGGAEFDIGESLAGQTLAALGLFQDTGFRADFTAPAAIQAGAAIDVSPTVTLLASTTLTRWRHFDEIRADFDNPAQPDDVATQNWRDAWSFSAGAEFKLSPKNTARIGAMYEESPVNQNFATTRIPDADRVWAAAGLSRELNARARLNLAAAYIFFGDIAADQSAAAPENLFRGALTADFESSTVLLSAGVDWRF